MNQYLDPKHDLTFKRVFGEHKHLCMSLLNSMLPLKNPIVSIEYQSGELLPELDILRNTIVDVRCIDSEKRQFIVEMQLFWYESFKQRVLLNASKAYLKQLDKGDKIKLLQPVYSLNFVNEKFEKSPDKENVYYHHYQIVNINDTEQQIEGLEFVFIELPKFKPQNRAQEKLHELWLRFLTEIDEDTKNISEDLLNDTEINEAIGFVERGAYSKEQLDAYDKWKIDLFSAISMLDDAETKGIIKGKAEGRAEGKAEGRAEGKAEGRAEGKAEGRVEEKVEIAKELKSLRVPFEQISVATKLSIAEIEKL
jgi:predicted transposase/invertase (TIGR01784 family)